ncbi:MAG: hypothetical protein JRI83_07600 [Deltaproteobacteria bacterium]|nr:hypothetical protein [Deltaproteobacteria bacterium]
MAARLLAWRHKKAGLEIPDEKRLTEMAKGVVEEAHRIARQRGQNVWGILKELVQDVKK